MSCEHSGPKMRISLNSAVFDVDCLLTLVMIERIGSFKYLCKQVCLNPAASDLRFSHLCFFSEVTGNLHSFLFEYLANKLLFSHLGPPLLHCEASESTLQAVWSLEQLTLSDAFGPHCRAWRFRVRAWRFSQLLPSPADLCGDL